MGRLLRISDKLALPLDWMSLATVVYGARGSGKTTFGSVVAEEVTKARQRFCAIDLKGDWHGLKSTADGKGEGIPIVVFGGDHADVPLEDGAGKFLGETIAGISQSCILDLEHLSKGKQIRFLAEFFETLYHVNRDPLLLLLDEAQRYAPQKPGPDEARCLGAVQDTVKLGRKHGLGVVVFTQRGAGLSKEVSELCDMLVAFRTPGPLDQDRIKDWLDANTTKAQRDDVMGKLAGLATGTAIFASGHPDLKIFGEYPVRRRETFDSSATPKVGQRRVEPKVLAKPELAELRTKMSAAIERQKADDPKELRKRIAELEREAKAKGSPVPAKPVEVTRYVFDEGAVDALQNAVTGGLDALHKMLRETRDASHAAFGEHRSALRKAVKASPPPKTQRDVRVEPVIMSRVATERHGKPVALVNGEGLSQPKQRILNALALLESIGLPVADRVQLALFADQSPTSSGYLHNLGALTSTGLIVYPGPGLVQLTSDGRRHAVTDGAPTTSQELHAVLRSKVTAAKWGILEELIAIYPNDMSREELAQAAGQSLTSSGYLHNLGSLRTLGVIDYPTQGRVVAKPVLFLEGR